MYFIKSLEILFETPLNLKWVPIDIPQETRNEFNKIVSISEKDCQKYEEGKELLIEELKKTRLQTRETQKCSSKSLIEEIVDFEESKITNKKQEVNTITKIIS